MIKTTPQSLRMLWQQPHIPFIGLVSCASAACKIKTETLKPQRSYQVIKCKPLLDRWPLMTRKFIVKPRIKCPLEKQCHTVAPGSLTTPRGTGNHPHGEVKQSCWSLPVWCPQEISVLVPMAWALGRKGNSPSLLSQKWSTGSSTPHPLKRCSSHTDLKLERTYIPAPSGASKSYKDMENHLGKSGHSCGLVENGSLL